MSTKSQSTKKADTDLMHFDDWIRQDLQTCLASIDIVLLREKVSYGDDAIVIDIGIPFDHPDFRDKYHESRPLEILSSRARVNFPEEGRLVAVDGDLSSKVATAVLDAALKALNTKDNMKRIREDVELLVKTAHRIAAEEVQLAQERENDTAENVIERAGAETADVVAIGSTKSERDRWGDRYETVTSYDVYTPDENGNWQLMVQRYRTQALVRNAYPEATVAFCSPQDVCKISLPEGLKVKKPTRAQLEAELAELRAKANG